MALLVMSYHIFVEPFHGLDPSASLKRIFVFYVGSLFRISTHALTCPRSIKGSHSPTCQYATILYYLIKFISLTYKSSSNCQLLDSSINARTIILSKQLASQLLVGSLAILAKRTDSPNAYKTKQQILQLIFTRRYICKQLLQCCNTLLWSCK